MDNKENTNDFSIRKKVYIFIIALIGFVTTIKLAMIYYDANFNPYALSSFCSINETVRQKVGEFSIKMNFVTIRS